MGIVKIPGDPFAVKSSSVDSSSSVDVARVVVGSEQTVAAEFAGSLAATVVVAAGSAG